MHVITNMLASGGAEVMLLRLARATARERPIIVSLMGVSDRHRDAPANRGIDMRALSARSPAGFLSAAGKLARLLREERPDALMCWLYHAMIVGEAAAWHSDLGLPVYWNVRQSLDDIGTLTASTRLALALSRRLSSRPAGILFNSHRALELHKRYGFRNANCLVIPNGFDRRPPVPAKRIRASVFGIAGRLHAQKDYPTFLAAAAAVRRRYPEVCFIAAGAGLTPDNPVLLTMLAAANLPLDAIDLRGNLADMASFYHDIDCLVLSSRTEGFPNVVAEAMSFGRPVVSTDVGDAAAIVADTGFVVPAGDPAALAEAMERMVRLDPDSYVRLASAARRRVDQSFSLQSVVRRYEQFLQGAAGAADAAEESAARAAG